MFCHFYKGYNFCDFRFAIRYIKSLLKKSAPKEKNSLLRGEFFPFRVDSFSDGRLNDFDRVVPLKVYQSFLKTLRNLLELVPLEKEGKAIFIALSPLKLYQSSLITHRNLLELFRFKKKGKAVLTEPIPLKSISSP